MQSVDVRCLRLLRLRPLEWLSDWECMPSRRDTAVTDAPVEPASIPIPTLVAAPAAVSATAASARGY